MTEAEVRRFVRENAGTHVFTRDGTHEWSLQPDVSGLRLITTSRDVPLKGSKGQKITRTQLRMMKQAKDIYGGLTERFSALSNAELNDLGMAAYVDGKSGHYSMVVAPVPLVPPGSIILSGGQGDSGIGRDVEKGPEQPERIRIEIPPLTIDSATLKPVVDAINKTGATLDEIKADAKEKGIATPDEFARMLQDMKPEEAPLLRQSLSRELGRKGGIDISTYRAYTSAIDAKLYQRGPLGVNKTRNVPKKNNRIEVKTASS